MSNTNFSLSQDQRRLVNMYINQYNQVNLQINHLFDMLDDIRENISQITNLNINRNPLRENSRPSVGRNSTSPSFISRYMENLMNEERQNNYIFYDYNSPINPSIYTNNSGGRDRPNTSNESRRRQSSNNLFRNSDIDISNFLSNFLNTSVIIRPTNQQILNSSRVIRYGDISNPLSETCPISLERFDNDDMVTQILYCGHIFCQNQFQEWFNNNVRCPVCRYDIRNYRPNRNSNINSNNQPLRDEEEESLRDEELNEEQTNNSSNSIPENNESNQFSNVNISRNPDTNQIDQIAFDITNNVLTNDLLNNITNRMFNSMFNSNTNGGSENDRFVFDPSNNILLFETLLRPTRPSNTRNNNNN